MKDLLSGRPPIDAFHRVEHETQARMLMAEDTARYFLPFLARDRTVGEAAGEVGCEAATMLYRVKTFVRAGLLRVVEERARAGRPIKVYRSVHDAYLIPYALTPFATLEEAFYAGYTDHARALARAMARRFADRRWDGYRLFRNAYGDTWREGAPDADRIVELDDPDRPVGFDFVLDAYLTPDEATTLQRELHAYLERFVPQGVPQHRGGERCYQFGVSLVPIDEADRG